MLPQTVFNSILLALLANGAAIPNNIEDVEPCSTSYTTLTNPTVTATLPTASFPAVSTTLPTASVPTVSTLSTSVTSNDGCVCSLSISRPSLSILPTSITSGIGTTISVPPVPLPSPQPSEGTTSIPPVPLPSPQPSEGEQEERG